MKVLNVSFSLFSVFSLFANIQEKVIPVTVFIHGTISPKSNLSIHSIIKIVQDDIDKCLFKKVIDQVRQNKFFFCTQPIKKIGLRKINFQNLKEGKAANLFANLYNQVYTQFNSETEHHYYTFGWSGLLSAKYRYSEAVNLYKALKTELAKFNGAKIKLDVVGFSHGGNVALNLATVKNKHYPHDDLQIDNLILIGTPVQKLNSHCINHDIFKKVYNFYSSYDMVQKIDFLTSKQFLCGRSFKNICSKNNLKQVELQVAKNNKIIGPGHTELWYFGWTADNYRKSFPIYPLPIAILIPSLIKHVDNLPEHKNLLVQINADQNKVKILNKKDVICNKNLCHNYFELNKLALAHKPKNFNKKTFRKKMHETKRFVVRNSRSQVGPSLKVAAHANSKSPV